MCGRNTLHCFFMLKIVCGCIKLKHECIFLALFGSLDFFLLSSSVLFFFEPVMIMFSPALYCLLLNEWKELSKKTFENNGAAFEFISLSENVICCLYWWDFNSVEIMFAICASFCCTNEDNEKRGKFHLLTILYCIYTVRQTDFLDELITLDN